MSGLEQAIRNALERAERSNPDVRARIYQSARNALETGLRNQHVNDLLVVGRQRQVLEDSIRLIENEELERLATIARLERVLENTKPEVAPVKADRPPEPEPFLPAGDRPEIPQDDDGTDEERQLADGDGSLDNVHAGAPTEAIRGRPPLTAERAEAERVIAAAHQQEDELLADLAAGRPSDSPARHEEEDPAWAASATPASLRVTPARKGRIRRAGSLFVSLFVYSVIFGFIGAGAWWVHSTGLLQTLADREGNVPRVTPQASSEDFDPSASPLDPQRGFSGEWISLFKPGSGKVTAHEAAKISEVKDSDGTAVLVTSGLPDSRGEVDFEIPAADLQDMAGKNMVFAITVKTDRDKPTQIYVECDLSTLGDCGRHRYTVLQDRADQLFKLDLTGKLAPSQPGHIRINSDITGGGGAVRLYGIRALPGG